jgi:hypothetical protein
MSKSTKKTNRKPAVKSKENQGKKGRQKKSAKKQSKVSGSLSGTTAAAKARNIDPAFDEKTTLDTAYLVNGSDAAVTLEMILGAPGQTGTTDILLDSVNIITGEQGSLPEFALGTNKKLNGRTLQITTVASDTAMDTNYLESIIRIRGGIRFSEYVLFKTVEKQGGHAIFTSRIEFFKI